MSSLRRDFLPEDLKPELANTGFDGSIAVQACHTLEETRWLLQMADRDPSIVGVVGWVDLRSAAVRSQLTELAQNPKLLGVRHVVQSEPDDRFLMQPDFLRGVRTLEEFDLTYDILIYPRHLSVASEFVARFPRQRFVLDHLAKPLIKAHKLKPWDAEIRALGKFSNVMCKVSGLVTEADWRAWRADDITPYLDAAFEAFGPERLMIGSDWPVCTVAASYAQVMELIINYLDRFPAAVRDAVLGGNAQAFWKLQPKKTVVERAG